MEPAPRPANDPQRLEALDHCAIWDTQAEAGFDDLVDLAATIFNVPMCLVSLVGRDKQWFKAKIGVTECETSRDASICAHAVADNALLVVEDVKTDPRFHDNPAVIHEPHIRFYAGAPVHDHDTGYALGTLCIIDTKPRKFTKAASRTLIKLAAQVSDQIQLRRLLNEASSSNRQLNSQQSCLVREVDRRGEQVMEVRKEVIHCLARAGEQRDDDTGFHVKRVSLYVKEIAEELGFDPEACEAISLASTLHDVGKIGIPDAILLKPGKLSDAEFEVIKAHTTKGARIIQSLHDSDIEEKTGQGVVGINASGEVELDLLQMACRIALSHHERVDGSGYPKGLAGEAIPLEGRIVAVADVYDALSSDRVYKRAMTTDKCREILEDGRGKHFDPVVLDAFFARFDHILAIRQEWTQPTSGPTICNPNAA